MKQATLFKAWHSKGTSASEVPKPKDKPPDDMIDLSDDDDEFLVQAMDETLAGNLPSTSGAHGAQSSAQKPLENLEGFDVAAGQTWIYPTNYPVRSYQFNIVQSCLFKNTMVILPTGLGKTFIAAVVMYNFYRWYPRGKIIFMAPTRPLVAQQIEACYKIMGIPLHDTLEMTGTVPAAQRAQGWRERRVFFLTPQVMMNDLLRNALKPQDIKCLVIDEAHKALGNYSYCQVVQEIVKYSNQFRILALSATPGTDMKGVRNVLANLMISHVELRTEDSIDIQSYTQKRTIEKVVVPLGAEIGELKAKFLGVMRTYLERLERCGALPPRLNPESLGKYRMLLLKEAFQQNPPSGLGPREVGQAQGHFSLLISLYHAFELLLAHGMQPFFYFLKGIIDGEKSQPRVRYELMHNGDFEDLYVHLERRLGASKSSANDTLHPTAAAASLYENTLSGPGDGGEHVVGHPKLAKLEEIILQHFRSFADSVGGTRVMVFSQYRDSVKEITAQLNRHQPVVKAMNFVGQRTGTAKGFSQKEQLLVVRKFREGGYNVLVSTCVGEEGLDIGEIDLIVCFDAPKSPIRLVQRMGRTGRKREGRIVVLLTEGKEEQAYKESNYKKQNIHRAITNGRQLGNLYEQSPRMVPRGIHPVCHRMHMTVPDYDTARGASSAKGSGKGTRSILNFISGKQKKSASALNRQEELYYEAHYEVAPSAAPVLPAPSSSFLTLPQSLSAKHQKAETERDDASRPRLSLCSWTQWQSNEHRSHFVSHSSKTQLYVRVMRFIETTRYADDELDTYSLELKPFLQMEYVLSSDELRSEPDPDLVHHKAAKPQRRKKYSKKKTAVAEEATEDEESPDSTKTETKKKKKKKRVITDFFKDLSRSGGESPLKASGETGTCEVAENMDCEAVVELDDDPVEEVPPAAPEQLDVDGKEDEELELEEEPAEVEIRTPPRLDIDIFPSPGRTLPPVDMAKIVFGDTGCSGYHTRGERIAEPALETKEREMCDVAWFVDAGCSSHLTQGKLVSEPALEIKDREKCDVVVCEGRKSEATSSAVMFSKLEVDSDLEDLFAGDGFEDGQPLDSDKESLAEELLFAQKDKADENPELKVDKRRSVSASPVAVDGTETVESSVHADSFGDELFDSEVDLFEDCAFVKEGKVDSNKKDVVDPIVISSQMPSPEAKLDELVADECAEQQPNYGGQRASSPIVIPSQKHRPPVHSTPCRSAPPTALGTTKSLRVAANASIALGEPSPIRKPVEPVPTKSDWNILGDSDEELFGDASDGDRISDGSNDASADEKTSGGGNQEMGITELCNFIEENSVVETSWKGDDSVFRHTSPIATSKHKLALKSASGGPATSRSGLPPVSRESSASANASKDAAQPASRVKSLSIRKLAETTRSGSKVGDMSSERSVNTACAKSPSVLQESRGELPMHTRTAINKSATRNSSAAVSNAELNETSNSKRRSFEITVDWSGFDSEDSADGPAPPAETLTQLRKKRESALPATLSSSSMTQSRNVPVAMVKPMVSVATKAKKDVSSDEDSPIRVRRKRPRQRQLSSGSSASEPSPLAIRRRALSRVDDSDDDFQVHTGKKPQQTQRSTPRVEASKRKSSASPITGNSRKKSSKKVENNFIEQEANVSTDVINSSDESENSSLDQLDESFIDDQTQAPNKTIYLRTVRSPVGVSKFKIGHTNRVRYSEVFSQAVSEDEADYIQDSFCVGSDDQSAVHRSSSSASEKEVEEESPTCFQIKTRRRKRRVCVLSSEDESCHIESVKSPTTANVDSRVASKRISEQPIIRAGPKSSFPKRMVAADVSSCAAASLPGNRPADSPAIAASQMMSREERLRLQKIRQEEFRRTHLAGLLDKSSPSAGSSPACQSPVGPQVQTDSIITIVVDTREIASGTVLVSTLRASAGVRVEVCSLPVGSLVLGRRCCVLRRSLADFGSPHNSGRLVDEVRQLFGLYDRPCVLLEGGQRVKPGERPFKRTKHFDLMLAYLTSTHAKVLFSQSQGNSAELVLALARREHQKGMSLASADCLQESNQLVQFYLTFPMVSLATALSLASAYPSVRALMNSSAEEIQERTKISGARAKDILTFCRTPAIL